MSSEAPPAPTEPQQQDGAQNETKSPAAPTMQIYRQIAADHIDQLNDVNAQLPKLLTYFAALISQLTNNPIETPRSKGKPDSVYQRQESMWVMVLYLGTCIGEIRDALVKQINDLERYGVIPAKHPKYTALPREPKEGQPAPAKDPEAGVKNGGYGDFDVGVLNARAALGQAGAEDMLDKVKTMVEELARRSNIELPAEDMVVDG